MTSAAWSGMEFEKRTEDALRNMQRGRLETQGLLEKYCAVGDAVLKIHLGWQLSRREEERTGDDKVGATLVLVNRAWVFLRELQF